jgi:glycosyltransferase involved in cell wall biosynthesis
MKALSGSPFTPAPGHRAPPRHPVPLILVGNGSLGGVQEQVLSTVSHLRSSGRRVLIAAPYFGEFAGSLLDQGLPPEDLIILEMGEHLSIDALSQLVAWIECREVGLLHSHLRPADNLAAAAGLITGRPALSTLHGTVACPYANELHTLFGLRYIAVSESTRARAIANGVRPDAIRLIHNGVDLERFNPAGTDGARFRATLGVARVEILVTCVARLSWEKYPEGVLEAALLVLQHNRAVKFAFVGTGPLEYKLRRLIRQSDGERNIFLVGPRIDIPEVLAGSDIVALTSLSEGLPFAVLEAMAMGVPVVAHDVGGIGEAVENGLEGFLLVQPTPRDLASRILQLACDRELRERLGVAGRRKVARCFRADQANAAILAAYDEEIIAWRTRKP